MNNVLYSNPVPPADYKCGNCGATGVKLWREYQTMQPGLFCAKCAAKHEHKSIKSINAAGMRITRLGGRTDQIGWLVPAVPDEEGLGYWGYTSVPQAGVEWWKALPTMKQ
jgi:hypothetical protein